MAAPNLRGFTTMTGKTPAAVALTTTGADILVNAAASNKVMKINALYVANIHATDACEVDIKRGATYICKGVSVPQGSTLVVIDKESHIYLEEDVTLSGVAEADSKLVATVGYEEIE